MLDDRFQIEETAPNGWLARFNGELILVNNTMLGAIIATERWAEEHGECEVTQ